MREGAMTTPTAMSGEHTREVGLIDPAFNLPSSRTDGTRGVFGWLWPCAVRMWRTRCALFAGGCTSTPTATTCRPASPASPIWMPVRMLASPRPSFVMPWLMGAAPWGLVAGAWWGVDRGAYQARAAAQHRGVDVGGADAHPDAGHPNPHQWKGKSDGRYRQPGGVVTYPHVPPHILAAAAALDLPLLSLVSRISLPLRPPGRVRRPLSCCRHSAASRLPRSRWVHALPLLREGSIQEKD